MSQMRNTLAMIDKKAGVSGIVLRPLSAKLLEPTISETKGLVDRDKLHDFHGRSRKSRWLWQRIPDLQTTRCLPTDACLQSRTILSGLESF